jgi:hypothetical protein
MFRHLFKSKPPVTNSEKCTKIGKLENEINALTQQCSVYEAKFKTIASDIQTIARQNNHTFEELEKLAYKVDCPPKYKKGRLLNFIILDSYQIRNEPEWYYTIVFDSGDSISMSEEQINEAILDEKKYKAKK